jgi:glycosyltransferase involved in cell wall biosynthesis
MQTRIGYVGTLAPRFDVELVAAVAKARPDWVIELVGPLLPLVDISPLHALPNVELTGEIPFEDVPARLATFDVCLLPLREIDFAYYCSPIQVFDYLAAGKPVVSTPVGQLEGWDGLVHVVRGAQAFVNAVEQALGERTPEHVLRRRVFAARNTWDNRIDQITQSLADIGINLAEDSSSTAGDFVDNAPEQAA